jgi:fatty-acyl-CoA synthase
MVPSYNRDETTRPLLDQTIGDNLDEIAARFPDREALISVFENERFTYARFRAEVERVARAFLALGVEPGEHVGIWSQNCVPWVLTQFATAKIGAVLVNINPAYRLSELAYAVRQSDCRVLVTGRRFKDSDYLQLLGELIPELNSADPLRDLVAKEFPRLRRVILLAETPGGEEANHAVGPAAPPAPERTPGPVARGMLQWGDFLGWADRIPPEQLAQRQAALDCKDVINLQYTSGTTGFPKGALLTHHNILNNGFWSAERMRFTERDRLCIPVPFYHCFGMVLGNLACVTHGATMVLPAPHFSPLQTLETVARERCTALHGVPTMFIAELEHPRFREFDLSSLRTGIMAGAPCPVEVMKRVMNDMHCPEITIACGMTETSPLCNMTEVNDPLQARVGTVGKVMPHQEQRIVDPLTGETVPRGEAGELCYRGHQLMRGYYNNPRATRDIIDRDGWLHSGDMAVMDDQGYVRITGRLKDMICRGGEKIFPREVEEFLFQLPSVAEAAVFGVPDPYYGEQVAAWVRLREGVRMTAEDLKAHCRGQIMDYKIPLYVKFVDDFPKTVTGKIQKYRMREITVAELGLSEPAKKAA